MWALLIPLISQLFGEKGPLGQYFKVKSDMVAAEQTYKLELLKAQSEQAIAEATADTAQRSNYLNATTQNFRQGTFYWVSAIILYSIIFPSKAEVMWHNFSLIPEWVQYIYVAMLSVTWGLPIAKENIGLMFASVGRGIDAHRDYKLEKARINRTAVFDSLRKDMGQGVDQKTVDMIDHALDAGEQG